MTLSPVKDIEWTERQCEAGRREGRRVQTSGAEMKEDAQRPNRQCGPGRGTDVFLL